VLKYIIFKYIRSHSDSEVNIVYQVRLSKMVLTYSTVISLGMVS